VYEEIIERTQDDGRAADKQNHLVHLALGDVGANGHPQPAQDGTPDGRTDQREDGKFKGIKFCDSRRHTDELPRTGEQARDEHSRRPVMRHPVLAFMDLVRCDQNVTSIPHQQRTTRKTCDPIDDGRPQPRAERAGDDDGGQANGDLSGMRPTGRDRDDAFAGQRQHGAFAGHQQADDPRAIRREGLLVPINHGLKEMFHGAGL